MNMYPDAATFWYWVVAVVGGIIMGVGSALYANGGIRRDQADRVDDLSAATLLERRRQQRYERNPWD